VKQASLPQSAEMTILRQSNKVRRHMAMMTLVLLILLPFAAFASMILVAAFASDSPPDGVANGTARVAVLGLPILLLVWGVRLLSRLREGFTASTRRRLFAFYVGLVAYCGAWMVVPWSHGDTSFVLMPPSGVLVITLFIAIPAFATMFTNEEIAEVGSSDGGQH
jgi:hypothetical protein